MTNWMRRAGLPAVAAFAVVLSGCDLEVLNPGAIQDSDLVTPELMPVLVAGVSAEYNDVQDSYAFDIARLSDELAGTGSYGSTQDYRTGFFTDQDAEGDWEQMHEAAWAADQAWQRLQQVLEGAANSSPDAARLFVLRGHAFNRLGEAYCRVVFDIGPSEDRSVAFTKAKAAFQQALTIQASGEWANAALMGIAQSEFLLAAVGAGSWATADAAAPRRSARSTTSGTPMTRSTPRVRTPTCSGLRRGIAPRSACTARSHRRCVISRSPMVIPILGSPTPGVVSGST